MPREQVVIEQFRGMASGADARDVDLQFASHAVDVDTNAKKGELRGRLADVELNATANAANSIKLFRDGTEAIAVDASDIKHVSGLPGTPGFTTLSSPTNSGEMSLAGDGNVVRVGTGNGSTHVPQWVGQIEHSQFNGLVAAPAGATHVRDARLEEATLVDNKAASATSTHATTAEETVFPDLLRQVYAVSYEYDGYQHGPMHFLTSFKPSGSPNLGYSEYGFTVEVDPTSFPDRVTGINIWRAPLLGGDGLNYGDVFRLVKNIGMDDTGWSFVSPNYEIAFNDTGYLGDTWERITGLPEKAPVSNVPQDNLLVNYQHNEMINGYHMVAKVYHPELTETENTNNWLFRSLRNRPDMYNWAEDFLVLPAEISALAAFQGRLYAFAEGTTYRIDPESLQIEDVISGIGASSQSSIIVTERGMFFCNKDNIWWHNGREITPIGNPVFDNDYSAALGWHTASHSVDPVCTYDGKYDNLIVAFESTSGIYHALIFNIPTGSWFIYSLAGVGEGAPTVGFIQHSGEPVLVLGGIYVHVGGSSSRKSWQWVSKEINNGIGAVIPYDIYVEGDANNIKFRTNENTPITYSLIGNANYNGFDHRLRTNSQIRGESGATSWGRFGKLRFEINGDSSDEVNVFGLHMRRVRTASGSGITDEQVSEPTLTTHYLASLLNLYTATVQESLPYPTSTLTAVGSGRNFSVLETDQNAELIFTLEVNPSDGNESWLVKRNLDGTGATDILHWQSGDGWEAATFVPERFSRRLFVLEVNKVTNGYRIRKYDYDGVFETQEATDNDITGFTSARGLGISADGLYLFWRERQDDGSPTDKFYRRELATGVDTNIGDITPDPAGVYDAFHDEYVIDPTDDNGIFLNVNENLIRMPYPDGVSQVTIPNSTGSNIISIDRLREKLMYVDNTIADTKWMESDYDGQNEAELLTLAEAIVSSSTGYN